MDCGVQTTRRLFQASPPHRPTSYVSSSDGHQSNCILRFFSRSRKRTSRRRLVTDARRKAFTGSTSICLFFGVKIYRCDFQCYWAERHRLGQGMSIMQRTNEPRFHKSIQITFTIPQGKIWWGSAAQAIPPTTTPHYFLILDWLHRRINETL